MKRHNALEDVTSQQLHARYMWLAIAAAKQSKATDNTPFGAVIVRDDEVLSAVHNEARSTNDPTCHAEVNAIRNACAKLCAMALPGCTLYTTCEPCPMCFIAANLADIETIVFGLRNEDLFVLGWNVDITAAELNQRSGNKIKIVPDILREECLGLFGLLQQDGESK